MDIELGSMKTASAVSIDTSRLAGARIRAAQHAACDVLGYDWHLVIHRLRVGSREADVVAVRHLTWWLLYHRCGWRNARIRQFFDIDNGSILYGLTKVRGRLRTDPEFAQAVERRAENIL